MTFSVTGFIRRTHSDLSEGLCVCATFQVKSLKKNTHRSSFLIHVENDGTNVMNRHGGAFADCEDLNCVSRHVAVATFKIAKSFFFCVCVKVWVGTR